VHQYVDGIRVIKRVDLIDQLTNRIAGEVPATLGRVLVA
jgi:hypothetical protein